MYEKKRVKFTLGENMPHWKAKIIDAETGEDIPMVTRFHLNWDIKEAPVATIWTVLPIANLVVDAEVHTHCPLCGQEVNE